MPSKAAVTSRLSFFNLLPCVIVITLFCLAIPLILLTIGITKRDDCQADPRIPKWMIVVAVLMLIERFIGSVNTIKDRRFIRENPKPVFEEDGDNHALIDWTQRRKHNKSSVFAVLGAFIRLVQFITFILGCVYVFGIYSISDQCNPLVFWTSFIYCLLSIIFYIIGACVLGCVCCCVALMNDSFAQ